jgi:hypothetical protein
MSDMKGGNVDIMRLEKVASIENREIWFIAKDFQQESTCSVAGGELRVRDNQCGSVPRNRIRSGRFLAAMPTTLDIYDPARQKAHLERRGIKMKEKA